MDYFCHESSGVLRYGSDHWVRVMCDRSIIAYYAWLLKKYGLPVQLGSAHGAHISVVRGELPPNPAKWGLWDGQEIRFKYSTNVRMTDWHAWLDCQSDQLNELRATLGYPPKPQKRLSDGRILEQSYHLTIGRV